MDLKLDGKRALVTGGSGGLGGGIADFLAAEGVAVAVHGRNRENAETRVREIEAAGGTAVAVIGDVNTDAEVAQVAAEAIETLGGIDILVNNAGSFFTRNDWMDITPDEWLSLYNTNVAGMIRMIHGVVPQMRELGWGRIIQVASIVGTHPLKVTPEYAASKAAIINLTCSLSQALANTGITVNSISPGVHLSGPVRTWLIETLQQMGVDVPLDDEEALSKSVVENLFPVAVGRMGTPEDVGALCTFLASPLAGYINGTNIRIDGGSSSTVG